ncbi:MAG TPA: HRDC domain-containing protein, partial [Thermodesulfobacteriota bacterium]|nr:HRDC domain-containing protein [Thermodesulfobacteriota bacterium]
MEKEPKGRVVTDPVEFRDLVAAMRASGRVGFDTEFVGERTYFPRLCLIQLGTKTMSAAVDPLAVGDLSPLDDLLFDPSVLKLVHAGWQDLKIIHQRTGRVPAPVFDTQIAAALLGLPAQAAYASVVHEFLGAEVKKGHSYSDWAARPLSPSQLAYALDDVRYLPALHDRMVERLEREGRLSWIEPEIAALSSPASYETDPMSEYRRVKGWAALDRRRLAVLRALIAWREGEARRRDVPRRRVLADESALAIARGKPA